MGKISFSDTATPHPPFPFSSLLPIDASFDTETRPVTKRDVEEEVRGERREGWGYQDDPYWISALLILRRHSCE